MHRTVTAVGLAVTLLLSGGCSTDAEKPAGTAAPDASASSGPLDPAGSSAPAASPAADCSGPREVNGQATDAYIVQLQKWVDADDAAGRRAALTAVRRIFATWSKDLLAQADLTTDPRLKIALTQYAGGVRAVIAGIRTPKDLERLENLDGSQIDVAASQLAVVCR